MTDIKIKLDLDDVVEQLDEIEAYTCSHCNGCTGETNVFFTKEIPQCCPFCTYHRHVMPLDEYREKYD